MEALKLTETQHPVNPASDQLLMPAPGTYRPPAWLRKYITPPLDRPSCCHCHTPRWRGSTFCIYCIESPYSKCRECNFPFGSPTWPYDPTVPRAKSDWMLCVICEVAPRYGNNVPSIVGHFAKLSKAGVYPYARLRLKLYRRQRLTAIRPVAWGRSMRTGSLLVEGVPGDSSNRLFFGWDCYQDLLCDVADLLWTSELVVMVKTRRVTVSDVSRVLLNIAKEILANLLRRERGRAAMLAA